MLGYHKCDRFGFGEVAEWLKALVSKTSIGVTQSGVQISLSPQRLCIKKISPNSEMNKGL